MKAQAIDQGERKKQSRINKKLLLILTLGGGVVFWVTSIVTSLLPVAAEYRGAFSNWNIETVWIGSLIMGMIFGCCVSYSLLRFFEKIPVKGPIQKSVILSVIALVIAIVLVDVPMILQEPNTPFYFFLIGVVFNATRFILLGFGIGYLYKKLRGINRSDTSRKK